MKNAREVVITSDSSGETYSAAVWDPLTGSLLSTYKNTAALGHRTLQIVGDTYAIGADVTKPRLYVWALNSQAPLSNLRLTTPGKVAALACTPDGSYCVAAIGEKLFLWQLTTGRLLGTVARHYQTINCLKFCQDGSNFASGGDDGLVFVWSLAKFANNGERCAPTHGFSDHSLPVKDLHYGNFAAQARLVSVSLDRTARIYDTNGGSLLLTLVFDAPLTSVCVDIREVELFVGSSNGLIMQFDLRDPPRGTDYHLSASSTTDKSGNAMFRGHTGSVTALSVSTDCRVLLSGSTDGAVHFWDIPSRQIVRTINHKGAITSASFAPAHRNFRDDTLRPKLQIRQLQRISDESGKNDVIDVIANVDDDGLLNFHRYEDYNEGCNEDNDDESSQKLVEARKEIERLKCKNKEIYEYAVKALMTKAVKKKK